MSIKMLFRSYKGGSNLNLSSFAQSKNRDALQFSRRWELWPPSWPAEAGLVRPPPPRSPVFHQEPSGWLEQGKSNWPEELLVHKPPLCLPVWLWLKPHHWGESVLKHQGGFLLFMYSQNLLERTLKKKAPWEHYSGYLALPESFQWQGAHYLLRGLILFSPSLIDRKCFCL